MAEIDGIGVLKVNACVAFESRFPLQAIAVGR